jgi:hypothetical protein
LKTEAQDETDRKDERELCGRFEAHLKRLEASGRCEWRREVRMLHWRHAADSGRRIIRCDYVARIDDGPLIGIEAKLAPKKPRDWGRYIKQCGDYANAIIGANSHIPQDWTGKPLHAVFLACEIGTETDYVRRYHAEAVRIASAFRVGFVRRRWDGLELTLSDDFRWWSETDGYRVDWHIRNTNIRAGSDGSKLEAAVARVAADEASQR